MANLTIHTAQGVQLFEVQPGTNLAEALRAAGHAVDTPCGGRGKCGKCRVQAQGALSAHTAEEWDVLRREELEQGVRLSCCTKIEGNCTVFLDWVSGKGQILTEGVSGDRAFAPMHQKLGAAIDIGTTTLAARLYRGEEEVASATRRNPQSAFGADVISRIEASMHGQAAALAQTIRTALNELLSELCAAAAAPVTDVDALVITGNTAMLHLLTETDPTPLSAAPFEAKELFGKFVPAAELGLVTAADAQVYLPRCISAFVGGDITTALLVSGICRQSQTMLLADIGTNGELAQWHNGQLLCCSTAAGPAFEGANLSCGMQGRPGAIDHARVVDGQLKLHVLEDAEAIGICGSGVADVLHCLVELEILDETGFLDDGEDEYALTDRVYISQKDVRQVQLAKSAIRAGMETLLDAADLSAAEVSSLQIAGGFGSYLSLDSAAGIGLIPPALLPRSRVLGNAALSGAAMLLLDRDQVAESAEMARSAQTVDLSASPVFMENYVEFMGF